MALRRFDSRSRCHSTALIRFGSPAEGPAEGCLQLWHCRCGQANELVGKTIPTLVVIFEVWPVAGRSPDYLDMAAALRTEVERIDGFFSVERFERLWKKAKLLLLQFWRDEAAIALRRPHLEHTSARHMGSSGMLANYRFYVAGVVRDSRPTSRDQASRDRTG